MSTIFVSDLGAGLLPNVKGTLYTVPAGRRAIIQSITLVNTDATTTVVNLYYKASGGTSLEVVPKDFQLKTHYQLISDSITLNDGDSIEGLASVDAVVTYKLNGIEEEPD